VNDDLDPDAWARNFLAAYAIVDADAVRTDAQRQMFVAGWFRAAMQAAIAEAERDDGSPAV
jgi:hypothetical protein